MRNFVDKKAGATFLKGYSYTYAVRQNHIEMILKVNKGLYGVVCLVPIGINQLSLTCCWGTFFNRLNNHENPGRLLQMLEKHCPTVCNLFTGETPYTFISFPDEDNIGAISFTIDTEPDFNLLDFIGDKKVLDEADKLFSFNCKLYNEIKDKCPFEGWKKGLYDFNG